MSVSTVTNHSRRLYGSVTSSFSRGKGGVCRITESANKFLPGAENLDNLNFTMEWKKWISEETLRIQKAFKKITKHGTREVQCPRCVKIVKVRTFLNHTTKPPGCKQILPEFRWVRPSPPNAKNPFHWLSPWNSKNSFWWLSPQNAIIPFSWVSRSPQNK